MSMYNNLRNLNIGGTITMSLLVTSADAQRPDPTHASIHELLSSQARGELTCRDIAASVLARISALDARLRVFITVNPRLMDDAQRLDAERATGALRPLHCIPVAVKDNFDTADLRTTGESVVFADMVPPQDSVVVAKLRAAGALIVGKTNLDEFAVAGSTISDLWREPPPTRFQSRRLERAGLRLQLWWVLAKRQWVVILIWLVERDLLPLWDPRRRRWIFRPPR
jgi:Amidase